jgi:hypothetical protein
MIPVHEEKARVLYSLSCRAGKSITRRIFPTPGVSGNRANKPSGPGIITGTATGRAGKLNGLVGQVGWSTDM